MYGCLHLKSENDGSFKHFIWYIKMTLPPHPVVEEATAVPPADEEDMGSRSKRNPSSSALNTGEKDSKGVLTEESI